MSRHAEVNVIPFSSIFQTILIYLDGWISTGGTYTGIMKYVGETVNKREFQSDKKMVLLGIANWTTVANKEDLILTDVSNKLGNFFYFLKYKFL